jgi:sulfur carrier protein
MKLRLNGDLRETPPLGNLSELLVHLQQAEKLVLVEKNGAAIARDCFATTTIQDGDTIEIVRMVAGG